MDSKKDYTIAAAVIGVSLILTAFVVSFYFYKVKGLDDVISVTGSSQQTIVSDVVQWSGSVTFGVGATGLADGNAQMQKDIAAIKTYLTANGVTEDQITISPVVVTPNYQSSDASGKSYYGGAGAGSLSGYTFTQNIQVESNDVQGVTKLAQNSGSFIEQGIPFTSNPLEYYYSKLSDLKVQMLADATKDAENRAQSIVGSTGAKLGALRSAKMGVMQITPVNSTEISDYGYYDTSSINKEITAIVTASFSVN
jgi:hypothetical protein